MQTVPIFFYGTFMSARILRDYGLPVQTTIPTKLIDYELTIRPRVNLVKRNGAAVYGGLAKLTHKQIASLYDALIRDHNVYYLPHPVAAIGTDGTSYPALVYISQTPMNGDPDPDYIKEMAKCAKEMCAPANYIGHIETFLV